MCSLLGQQLGMSTLRVVAKAGRLTKPEHVFVIVRNLVNAGAADAVGRVRLLPPDAEGMQVRHTLDTIHMLRVHYCAGRSHFHLAAEL